MGAGPRVVDWNEDGKKDLITGEYNGNIRIYLNTNTDVDPQFNGYTLVQVAGADFDCGDYSTVAITDWNNDGNKDVICGESGGKVWLLLNTNTNANPVFDEAVYIQRHIWNLSVPSRSSPAVVDWNRDGKKDLVVGEAEGKLFYFENVGTDADPAFNPVDKLKSYGWLIDLGYTSRPDAVDWDEDGVDDLIVGEYEGTVSFLHAVGPLSLNDNRIYESVATSIEMTLDAGTGNAGRKYLILGSASGTQPGFALPGGHATLPLNWDPVTDIVLLLLNSPVFSNFLGTLNGTGTATAQMNLPALPGSAGTILHFAYTLNNPFNYVSNAAALEVLP